MTIASINSPVGLITAGLVTATALVSSYFWFRKRRDQPPKIWKSAGTVKNLFIFPLKSGRRVEVDGAFCTELGLTELEKFDKSYRLRDRNFIIYKSSDKEFRTSRQHPKIQLIETSSQDINYVSFNAPGQRTLFVKIPDSTSKVEKIKYFKNEELEVIDCGDEAGEWLSEYILDKSEGLRLGYHPGLNRRVLNNNYKPYLDYYKHLSQKSTGLFSDLCSYMLLSEASVKELNTHLDNKVSENNFRPSIYVTGDDMLPFAEDNWQWIKIGDSIFRNVMHCTRCVTITIDPERGVMDENREPLKTLNKYRVVENGPDKSPRFGIYLECVQEGVIKTDDIVYVG